MIDIRLATDSDYETLSHWWKDHGWEPVPQKCLSNTGVIAFKGEELLAAGWLYLTGTSFSVMEWLVTNPNASLRDRYNGINKVVEAIKAMALGAGGCQITTSVKSTGLLKALKRSGFHVGDQQMTNLVWGKN